MYVAIKTFTYSLSLNKTFITETQKTAGFNDVI